MKTKIALLVAPVVCALFVGCNSKQSGGGEGAGTPPVTPARKTSFTEVTSQLDPGGNVYGYLATDQWLAGLSTNITQLRDFVLGLPDVSAKDTDKINALFDLLAKGVARSGLENLSGVGISGVQLTSELHRTKFIAYHGEGHGDGLIWTIFGQQAHALNGLDLLTTNTAIAGFGDLSLTALWQAIASGLGQSGIPEFAEGIQKFPAEFERGTKISWDGLLESLGGEVGLVLTLDEAHKISIPVEKESLEIPAPGLLLALKVNNDLLFEHLSGVMKKNGIPEFTEENGLRMYALPLPVPLPLELKITLARAGEYLFAASSPTLVREALAVRAGKEPGLRQTAEFQALQRLVPTTGNTFSYVDRRFSSAVLAVQKQIFAGNSKMPQAQAEMFEKFLLNRPPSFGLSVGTHTATGWETVSVGNQDASAAVLAAPVAGAAVGAAMVLPALAKAKEKAQSIACMNNMKQISIALRIWATDHDDKFPWNLSTSKGGTMELCERDAEGYDRGAAKHFQVLSNELVTPKILVCPGDKSKQVADSFEHLESWNVSYQLRTGPEVSDTNPEAIVLYCPVHHHIGHADGSVKQGAKTSKSKF